MKVGGLFRRNIGTVLVLIALGILVPAWFWQQRESQQDSSAAPAPQSATQIALANPTAPAQVDLGKIVDETVTKIKPSLDKLEYWIGERATWEELNKFKGEFQTWRETAEKRLIALEAKKTETVAQAAKRENATTDHLYMKAYQASLPYTVPANLVVPANLLKGFTPVKSLVRTDLVLATGKVQVQVPPSDITQYACFPQDYSKAPDTDPCKGKTFPWKVPIAGYNDENNWSCESPDGWCADNIQSWNWRAYTAYEICHPAVGCIKDPDGGAAMLLIVNFHDSDEVWNVRNNSAVYIDNGAIMYGRVWDLGGTSYNLGMGIATLRNHWLNQLINPVGGDNRFAGQCGSSKLCGTVTYVVIARVWDRPEIGIKYSHFELIDAGQWVRK